MSTLVAQMALKFGIQAECSKPSLRYLVSSNYARTSQQLLCHFIDQYPGGVTNFCFGRSGEMFVCAEQRLWRLQFGHGDETQLEMDRPGWLAL